MPKKPKKILIVEDEAPLMDIMRDEFTREGFTVYVARDGVAGLAAARRERPDLILLDIIMPRMDGITMLEKLRRTAWGKRFKVIVLTNLADDRKVEAALRHGAHEYLVRTDWTLRDVVRKVRLALG